MKMAGEEKSAVFRQIFSLYWTKTTIFLSVILLVQEIYLANGMTSAIYTFTYISRLGVVSSFGTVYAWGMRQGHALLQMMMALVSASCPEASCLQSSVRQGLRHRLCRLVWWRYRLEFQDFGGQSRFENLRLFLKLSFWISTRHFLTKRSTEVNWASGAVQLDFFGLGDSNLCLWSWSEDSSLSWKRALCLTRSAQAMKIRKEKNEDLYLAVADQANEANKTFIIWLCWSVSGKRMISFDVLTSDRELKVRTTFRSRRSSVG